MDNLSLSPEKIQNTAEVSSNKNESISPPSQATVVISHFEKRIQDAIDIKNDGNKQFKVQNYEQARNIYQKALGLLDPSTFQRATQAECVKMAEISANLLFNIGSCFFSQHRWREADLIYTEAIVVNPYYTKAIYKRALARYEMEQYEGAMTDIKQAFSFDKSNREIYESYEKIMVKYNESAKKQREKSKEMSSKIFNSVKEKPKEPEAPKQPGKQDESGNKWWAIALASLAGIGIYQGIKYLRN